MLDANSLAAIRLTIELSLVTTLVLLVLGTPLAWWIARGRSRWRPPVRALVSLPLVLPPSVLGFYLLVALGASGPLGRLTQALGWGTLAFTFWGLLLGSLIYSLPFVVQPLVNAFESLGERPLEAAATLRASPLDAFCSVALPLARPGYVTGAVMGFAHTLGEFGVVLMVGGNIEGQTRTAAIAIYDRAQAFDTQAAGAMAAALLAFSIAAIGVSYALTGGRRRG